jgi:protein involved in sex pheromone biosynthesis
MNNYPRGKVAMKALAFVWALAPVLMLSGCMTTQQEGADANSGMHADVKAKAKPVAKVTPKPRTPIRTRFIEI